MARQDDDAKVFEFSEQRRKDPVILEKAEKVLIAQKKAMAEAVELLNQASAIMRKQSGYVDSVIFDRCLSAVSSARYTVEKDSSFMEGIDGECYIGNLAAGRLGYQIEEMGEKFPL